MSLLVVLLLSLVGGALSAASYMRHASSASCAIRESPMRIAAYGFAFSVTVLLGALFTLANS